MVKRKKKTNWSPRKKRKASKPFHPSPEPIPLSTRSPDNPPPLSPLIIELPGFEAAETNPENEEFATPEEESIRDGGRRGDEGEGEAIPCDEGEEIRDEGEVIRDEGEAIRDEGEAIRDEGEAIRDEDEAIPCDEGESIRNEGETIPGEGTRNDESGAIPGDGFEDEEAIREEDFGDEDCGVQEDLEFGIEEEAIREEDFGETFGLNRKEAEQGLDGDDAESGDDICWDEERIPEPLSASEDEDEDGDGSANDGTEDSEDILKLGKCFNTKEEFKIAVLRYSLKTRYDIKLYLSQALRIGAKCSDKEGKCQWRCYASYDKKKQKMQIKVYVNVHVCVRSGYYRMLKQGPVAWLYAERLRKNPRIIKQEMAAEIKREYNLVVSEEVCAKAKSQLARQRRQSHETHFGRIWDYQAEVFLSNPESTFEIETIPGPSVGSKQRFYRLYMCFRSQRESWKNTCRPIIGLDGAFLRWDIKGHLLAAVGRDGDNRIVPIAWAIVEIENDDNWDWFVRQLSTNLGLGEGDNISVISDKQKGLIKAIHNILPQAEHRQCARHIMDNWKKDSHDMELQRLFWKIARSYNQGEFSKYMDELQSYNPPSYANLLLTNPASWSRAFFRLGTCCNDVLNNLCESFNRTIRVARRKPLLKLLEDIRRQCMVRNAKRSIIAERLQTRFTTRAHGEIEKMIAGSQFCERYMARHNLHEVEVQGQKYRVDMNSLTCGCRKWQMTGIPCVHAAAVIIGIREKVEDYVSEYYTTRTWRLTYDDGIGPVQGELMWPRCNRLGVLPPPWRRGNPGRPNNHARRKGRNEAASKTRLSRKDRVMTCSNCKQDGHNKASCKNSRVQTPPKRRRGRPRKEQEHREVLFGQGQTSSSQGQASAATQRPASTSTASQRPASQASQRRASAGSQRPPSQRPASQASQRRASAGSQRPPSQRPASASVRDEAERQGSQFWDWFNCSQPQP